MAAYVLPELKYDYGALEPHYSGQIVELHYSRHHAAYVGGANAIADKLAEVRVTGDFSSIMGLEKSLAFNVSGHVLHTIFWSNLSPDGGGRPDGELAAAITEHFGGFDDFKAQLTRASSTIEGSGWGALIWEPLGQRLLIEQIYDHQSNVANGSTPLLVFDAWEHAYYLQYLNIKADFFAALWNLVDWANVASRWAAAQAITMGS